MRAELAIAAAACAAAAALAVRARNRLTYRLAPGCMRGMRAVVTGGSSGIGLATARALAAAGAELIVIGVRDAHACKAACARVRACAADGCVVKAMQLELTSASSVRAFASSYCAEHEQVDLLVCNAGAMLPVRQVAPEFGGAEHTYAIFLGHAALVHLLEPALDASLARRGDRPRVVQVVSSLERGAPAMLDANGHLLLEDAFSSAAFSTGRAYAAAKCAQLSYALELSRRRKGRMLSCAISPGMVDTRLSRFLPFPQRALAAVFQPLLLRSADKGAETILFALSAPADEVEGRYLRDCKELQPSAQARSPLFGDRVWQHAEHVLAGYEPPERPSARAGRRREPAST